MNRILLRISQALGLRELVATLIVSGILLVVGIFIFAKVRNSVSTGLTSNANAAVNNIENTAYDSFELGTVALIILAAATIIGVLMKAFST